MWYFSLGSPDAYSSRHQHGKQPEERCAMQEESGSVEFKGDIRDSQTTKIVF